jgi:hypothetical protein
MPFVAAESVLRTWLAGHFAGVRVVTELPAALETVLPLIEVERIGGVSDAPAPLDRPRMDIWCYATGTAAGVVPAISARHAARDLAEQVRSALLYDLPGKSAAGGFVATVTEQQAPVWRPFDNTDVRRFQATYTLAIRSIP